MSNKIKSTSKTTKASILVFTPKQRQVPLCAARRGRRGIINQTCTRAKKVGGNTSPSARIDRGGTPPQALRLDKEGD